MKTGVFWVIDDELIAIPFDKFKYVEGIAKSGETYNHEKLWELVKPKNCNKPYNYYPRGRVVNGAKGKTIIYMNSNIKSEYKTYNQQEIYKKIIRLWVAQIIIL